MSEPSAGCVGAAHRHAPGECGNDCCRRSQGIATPYRTLYERGQQSNADLRRQLDEACRKLNVQGEVLRQHGLDTVVSCEHIDHLAAIQRAGEHQVQLLETMRLRVVGIVHDAEDRREPADVVLRSVLASLLRANDQAKNTPSMREVAAEVAAARAAVPEPRDPALEPTLFEVAS